MSRIYDFFRDPLLEKYRELTQRDNCKMLKVFEIVMAICETAMLISGFYGDYFKSLRYVYIFYIVLSLLMYLITVKYVDKHPKYVTIMVLLNLATMYSFCFFSGILFNINGPSISIYAFQVIACSAYLLPFSFTVFLHTTITIVYCILVIQLKPKYGITDAITGILFLMMGLGLAWMFYQIRIAYLKTLEKLTEQRNKALESERLERKLRDSEKKLYEESKQKELLNTALDSARDASNAKTVFLSNMSHDLRTPMNAIIGMVDLALENESETEQIHESLVVIKESSTHLLQLINDILDMSRIESGRINIVAQQFSQTDELASITAPIRILATEKNQHFECSIDVEHDECIADNERLHRIITNVLGNAVKFTPNGGRVSINVYEKPSKNEHFSIFSYEIRDTGIGMSEETVKHIFEAFYRSDEQNINNIEGTGLGLSIVKNLVELLGGTISVKSELGKGSKFTIEIPMKTSIEKSSVKKTRKSLSEHVYDLSGINVLLVEDHPINQIVATKILEHVGANVIVANNGDEAVRVFEKCENIKFDIILMDIQMPVLDGYGATKKIRSSRFEKGKSIPILAMTANAYPEDIKKCQDAGMNEHISKPISPDDLYTAICRYTSASAKLKKQKILVVDDVKVNAAVILTALRGLYDVEVANSGKQALEILEKNHDIVAVLTDIQMPEMNGIELIKKIRENRVYDNIAILANTQFGDRNQEEELLAIGADDFVYKPTTPAVIIVRLRNVLLRYQ